MRFEVPQFIEVEDKIFGPLTWRQFLYLSGGLGIAVVMFITLSKILFVILGIPIALLAGALAFYPVNSRPFSFFLEAIMNYLSSQKLYLWRQKNKIIHKSVFPNRFSPNMNSEPNLETNSRKVMKTKNITSLARRLELQALQKTE